MAAKLAATLTGPTGAQTRYSFQLLPGHVFDDGPADAVMVATPTARLGIYRLTRFGTALGRAWVRDFAAAAHATVTRL